MSTAFTPSRLLGGVAAGLLLTQASAQQSRVYEMSPSTGQLVHWTADSNLGPMGAFLQSYSFGGDIVIESASSPALGPSRITGARLRMPNTVVAAVQSGPGGEVFWRDIVLDMRSPTFDVFPTFPWPTFATTIDLFVSSGFVEITPPLGPASSQDVSGLSLGSIAIQGSLPDVGPTTGLRIEGFSFDMPFSATGFFGTFTHNVSEVAGTNACPAPIPYCNVTAATLGLDGSTSVVANDFVLRVAGAPPNTFGVMFFGPRAGEMSSGNGTVCVGGPLTRLGVVPTSASGAAMLRVDLSQMQTGSAALEPGSHRSFQFWHRNFAGTWNFSNGLAVTFCE